MRDGDEPPARGLRIDLDTEEGPPRDLLADRLPEPEDDRQLAATVGISMIVGLAAVVGAIVYVLG